MTTWHPCKSDERDGVEPEYDQLCWIIPEVHHTAKEPTLAFWCHRSFSGLDKEGTTYEAEDVICWTPCPIPTFPSPNDQPADTLTDRQHQVLDHIRSKIAEHGYAPTIREIGEALDMKSTNGVLDHIKALERKGYLRRTYGTARSIVLTEQALQVIAE